MTCTVTNITEHAKFKSMDVTKNPHEVDNRLLMLKQNTVDDFVDYALPNILGMYGEIGVHVSEKQVDFLSSVLEDIMYEHYGMPSILDLFRRQLAEFEDGIIEGLNES